MAVGQFRLARNVGVDYARHAERYARRAERWLLTSLVPAVGRWWAVQTQASRVAVIAVIVFALVAMLNLVGSGLGQSSPKASVASVPSTLVQEAAAPDAGKTWAVMKVWQGSGSKDTEEFVVGDHWRVDWIFSPSASGGQLQIFIYRADGKILASLAANERGGAGTSFWAGPGKYFLRVNATGGDWKIDVQDLR
jgi:Tol biopolymer transport system component